MKTRSFIIASSTAVFLTASSHAANIALADPSLEVGFAGTDGNTTSGWFTFGSTASAIQVDSGFWGPMTGFDGPNAAYATSNTPTDGGSIYQTVELDAGETYTFTVGISQSGAVNKNDANYALVFFDAGLTTVLAQSTGIAANQGNEFIDDSVTFTAPNSGQYQVGMRNRGHIPGTGSDNDSSTIFFDNARLEQIPEPSSTALLGFGGLALILRRRK